MNCQHSSPAKGFSLMEILIALALVGVLASFVVPKFIDHSDENQTFALMRDHFSLIGELYLAREKDDGYAAPDIGNASEQGVFATYLRDKLNNIEFVTQTDYCNPTQPAALAAGDRYFMTLTSGAKIRTICTNTTGTDTLRITVRIPMEEAPGYDDFVLVIPEDAAASGASAGRYTTLLGYSGGACPGTPELIDQALKICPVP